MSENKIEPQEDSDIAFCGYEEERGKPNALECCKKNRRCPTVGAAGISGMIKLGGREEGTSYWSKQQFKDFLLAAKDGAFDGLIQ